LTIHPQIQETANAGCIITPYRQGKLYSIEQKGASWNTRLRIICEYVWLSGLVVEKKFSILQISDGEAT
jgi:hypothetical protein